MIDYLFFAIGFVLLIKGADFLIEGASTIAASIGISQLMIGLTIVAFGTSMPELVVGIISSLKGTSQIVLGNVIGSNISNILLILGSAAVIYPVKIRYSTIWKEIPFSLLGALMLLALVNNDSGMELLSLYDGITLMFIFFIFVRYTLLQTQNDKKKTGDVLKIEKSKFYKSVLMFAGGLIGLFIGGKWVVEGAILIAKQLGFSEFLISATIIAVGTSLPELAVSIVASLKRKIDIAIGNVVGSNIFNIFLVLGISSIISPISVPDFVNADTVFLIYITVFLFVFAYTDKKKEIQRWHGVIFLLLYVGYVIFLLGRG